MTGRHVPASHPVLPAWENDAAWEDDAVWKLRLDIVALEIAHLPDVGMTPQRRLLLLVLAEELTRRAGS